MGRCICEGGTGGGPSTHRAAVHLSSCPHSTLREDTKRRKKVRVRPVPGTRKLLIEPEEERDRDRK